MIRASAFAVCFALANLALPLTAEACPTGANVVHGETVAQIAARCGVNAEALRQANPGLGDRTLRNGTFVVVPARPLPSPRMEIGGNRITIQPSLSPGAGVHIAVPRPAMPTLPPPAFQQPLIGHLPLHPDPMLQRP